MIQIVFVSILLFVFSSCSQVEANPNTRGKQNPIVLYAEVEESGLLSYSISGFMLCDSWETAEIDGAFPSEKGGGVFIVDVAIKNESVLDEEEISLAWFQLISEDQLETAIDRSVENAGGLLPVYVEDGDELRCELPRIGECKNITLGWSLTAEEVVNMNSNEMYFIYNPEGIQKAEILPLYNND